MGLRRRPSRSSSREPRRSPRRRRASSGLPRRPSGSEPTAGPAPITRHALYILESLDAIDPAYDTFAVALLDGSVDTSGLPEYAAVIGGVAAHWDESTGDLIVRAVVGWGGKGARGDTDRIASRLVGRILANILESGESLGLTALERPSAAPGGASVTCQHCGYPAVNPRAVYCPKCGMRMLHG